MSKKPKFKSLAFLKIRKTLGNILILISLVLFLVIYLPIFRSYIPFSATPVISESQIRIPKINAYAPLIDDVDPWNESEYRKALENGVAVAKGFSKPGEEGSIFVFAHSSDSPWRITSYNSVFFRLGELEQGDLIQIQYNGKVFRYEVEHLKEVWPNEVKEITNASGKELILQTCTPPGTSLKRLLVFAKESP